MGDIMYYLIINKNNNLYYANKSNDPQKSIEAHIRRANNPESHRYNTPLHKALREEGIDNFLFYKLNVLPKWVMHFKRYGP